MSDQPARAYEEELLRLRSLIAEMGSLTISQLEGAVDVAESFDLGTATAVVEREPEADRLEHQIDHLVIRLIALRQPVAADLREILAALRTANELERVCDHAESMAKRLIALQPAPRAPARSLSNLGRFATAMVKDVMRAYAEADAVGAQKVWDRDKELDEMYTALFRELITYMMEDAHRITSSIHMLFIARDIERVGDRATNIAEMVIYRARGLLVEEERPKADATKGVVPPA